MRNKIILILIVSQLSNTLISQNIEWHNTYHKGAISFSKDHTVYSNNGVFVSGNYNFRMDFSSTTLGPNSFQSNFYVSKYDTLGNLIWSLKGGADGKEDYLSDMKADKHGNIYLLGEFTDSLRLGSFLLLPNCPPSPIGPKKRDGFLIKVLPSGIVDWAKVVYGPNCSNIGLSKPTYLSVIDSSVFLFGEFMGSIRISNSSLVLNKNIITREHYAAKFDLKGNHLFLEKIVGINSGGINTGIFDVLAASDTTFYIALYLSGDYEFGSNKISYLSSGLEPVIIRYTMDSANWHIAPKGFGNINAGINNIMFDAISDSNVYLGGTFNFNTVINNDTLFSTQNLGFSTSWYIIKLSNQGVMLDNKVIPVDGVELLDFSLSKNSELTVLGSFTDSVIYLDSIKVLNKSSNDMLVYSLDSGLNYNWHLNESGFTPKEVVFDDSNSNYVLSEYRKSQNIGLNRVDSLNYANYLLVKLNDCKQFFPYDIGPDVVLDNINSFYTFNGGNNHAIYKWNNISLSQFYTISYDPLKAGLTDTIIVNTTTRGNCSLTDTAFVYHDFSTTLEEHDNNKIFKLYPNPFENDIHIATNMNILEVNVIDSRGREIISIKQPSNILQLESLIAGTYILRFITLDSVEIRQIIKR